MADTSETLAQAIERLGLSIRAEFVPFSKSRNAAEKHRSLNWRVTLVQRYQNGEGDDRYRDIITTDYAQGIGHAPAYKASVKQAGSAYSMLRASAIERETETGRITVFAPGGLAMFQNGKAIPAPSAADVVYSLAIDADVLNYARFEDWADELGFDSDSRKDEAIYKECMADALQLRAGLGSDGLESLQRAAQEY